MMPAERREQFWAELREEVEKRRRHSAVVIMGDLNGRVGNQEEDGWFPHKKVHKMCREGRVSRTKRQSLTTSACLKSGNLQ